MATKPKIPQWKRQKEAARRWMKTAAEDMKRTLKRQPTKRRTRRKKADQPKKKNPWFRCRTPGCYRWVPELCDHCQMGRAGITEHHLTCCCPGACDRCARCTLLCPGPCRNGNHCEDRCPGHEKDAPR